MVEMHEMVSGKRFDRYHELGQHAFGEKLGLWIVVPQQVIVEVGVDIDYMVTGGRSLQKVHDLVCKPGDGHNVVLEIQATIPSTQEKPSEGPMWRGVVVAYIVVVVLFPCFGAGVLVLDTNVVNEEKPIENLIYPSFVIRSICYHSSPRYEKSLRRGVSTLPQTSITLNLRKPRRWVGPAGQRKKQIELSTFLEISIPGETDNEALFYPIF
ncbi:Lysine histidine transporter-like 4 [Capsicum annuum]|nr:Lysine histidine transporter-like 4 [Capsicum annuum]